MDVWAPGRINLIGEHTDYSGGLALPAAIQVGLTIHVHKTSSEIALIKTSVRVATLLARFHADLSPRWRFAGRKS